MMASRPWIAEEAAPTARPDTRMEAPDSRRPLIELEKVTIRYGEGDETKTVLRNVRFVVHRGDIVGIAGESGSGKSTLAYLLCGLKCAEQGSVHCPSERIGYVMQNPSTAFDPFKTIGYTLAETRRAYLQKQRAKVPGRRRLARELARELPAFGIDAHRLRDYPHSFSGGELQRLAILRALLHQPDVLILDEATAMLDVLVQARILTFLRRLKARRGLTYIVISHDEALLDHFCDRVYRLKDGTLSAATKGVQHAYS